MKKWAAILLIPLIAFIQKEETKSWIRINQLGYTPGGVKVAVWCSKQQQALSDSRNVDNWQLVEAERNEVVYAGKAGKAFGAYGPFTQTFRLNFSAYKKPGRYYLRADNVKSPEFTYRK